MKTAAAAHVRPLSRRWAALLIAATMWLPAGAVQAAVAPPLFLATDLPQAPGAADRWALDLDFAGPLDRFAGVSFIFAAGSVADLRVDAAPATTQGSFYVDAFPGFDALVTFTAARALAGQDALRMRLSFDWLAGGAPGAQPYEQFDSAFTVVASGMTAPVPEPATSALLAAGAALLWAGARRRRPHDHSP